MIRTKQRCQSRIPTDSFTPGQHTYPCTPATEWTTHAYENTDDQSDAISSWAVSIESPLMRLDREIQDLARPLQPVLCLQRGASLQVKFWWQEYCGFWKSFRRHSNRMSVDGVRDDMTTYLQLKRYQVLKLFNLPMYRRAGIEARDMDGFRIGVEIHLEGIVRHSKVGQVSLRCTMTAVNSSNVS